MTYSFTVTGYLVATDSYALGATTLTFPATASFNHLNFFGGDQLVLAAQNYLPDQETFTCVTDSLGTIYTIYQVGIENRDLVVTFTQGITQALVRPVFIRIERLMALAIPQSLSFVSGATLDEGVVNAILRTSS